MLKNLLLLSGFSMFVVIVIVVLNVIHASFTNVLPVADKKHVIPITPSFDKKTLDELKKRQVQIVDLNEKSAIITEDNKKASESGVRLPTPIPTVPIAP